MVLDIGERAIDEERLRSLALETGLRVRHIVPDNIERADSAALAQALKPLYERMVVMTRGAIDEREVPLLVAQRQIPLLVVEPLALAQSTATAADAGR